MTAPLVASAAGEVIGRHVGRGAVKGAKALGPRKGKSTPGMKMLAAEFLVCIVIVAIGTSNSNGQNQQGQTGTATSTGAGQFMVQGTAMVALFLILGLFGAISPAMGKFSAGIGGLVAIGMAINQSSNFSGIVQSITSGKAPQTTPYQAPQPYTSPYSPTVLFQPVKGNGTLADSATPQTLTSDGQPANSTGSNITGFDSGIGGVPAGQGGAGGRYGT